MARKFFYFFVMFACVMVSCARIDDTVGSSQNDQPQIEDTENSTDEDGEIVDPYPHVELTDTLRIECQGDNKEEEKKENAEGEDDTKTYLNAQNHIYWKKGDRIKIYYADGGTNYTVSEIKHGDQQTSTFDALVDKNASYYYAFYPENIKAVMTDIAGNGAFEVEIPTTQNGKFENCHLAIGKSSAEDRSFSFKNIASYMKIVVDDLTATSLTLSARDENNAIVGTLVAPFADEAGNLGSLTLKNGTGSSSVTVNLASGRKAPCTIYVALLPGVNFSQGFRLRYNYDEQTGPGFAYTSNRSIERKKILNVGTLSNRIHTDWFVKTDGTISDPSQGGNSWDKALNTAGLVALLNQPTVDGVQDNALAYDKACVLDGATIHIAQGNYTLSELKLSATGYDNLVKVRILGSYPTGLTGTNTSATRDVVKNRTAFAGNGSSRILLVEDKVDLTLDKLWFSGGRSAVDKTHEAGTALSAKSTAIDQASNLSLSHCGFEDNVASGQNADGGAVYLSRATAYMENCEFKNNSCGGGQIGGAINLYDDDYHATLTLKSCQFSGNKAGLSGGAISCSKGRLYISGTENSPTVFEENSVETSGRTTRGGALLLAYASSVEVEYTNFKGNYGIATGNYGTEGGAVAFSETSYGSFEHVSFVGTKEAGKNAVRNGAHVSMDNTSVPAQATTFKNCSFTKGQASNVAGAIHIREYSKLSLEDCSFANNTTSNFGGAVHINNKNAQANFTDCTFSENSTKVYGGALSMEDGTCNFYNCSFTGNVGQYGAISLYFQKDVTKVSPNLNIYGCTFEDNSSTLDDNAATIDVQKSGGGAIYAGHGTVFVTSSDGTASGTRTSFTGNSAKSGGGAISLIPNNGTVAAEIKYADIEQNTASRYGGAIYANADLSMTDCILDNNTATLGASALYVSGNLTVTGSDMTKCAIRNHSESVSGSMIRYSTTSALSFTKCKISGNVLSDMTENGAYFPLKGSNSLSMTNCEFSGNTLPTSANTKYGGFAALYEGSTASLALTGTKVANCSGCKHGGAIYVKGGKSSTDGYALDISGGSFENCSCDAFGGVINFDTPKDVVIKAQIIGTSFKGNSAGYKGGVFHLNGNGNAREILLKSCTFSNNTHTGENKETGGGGGVINMAGGKLTINSCTFSGNKSLAEIKDEAVTTGAGVGGGVIYVNGAQKAELYIGTEGEGVLFEGNEATAYGGDIAIFNSNSESVIDINNAKFKENKSAAWGGGLYVKNQASLSLYNVGFTKNQVTTEGNGGDALFFDGTSFTMDGSGANLNYINDQTSTYPMHTPNVTEYTFNNFDFKRNTSTRDGALLHLDNSVARGFTITNSCLYGNSAPNNGGVIYADLHQDSRESLIENTQVDSNQVTNNMGLGGAIYWNCDSWNNSESTPGLKICRNIYGNSTLCKNKAGKSGSAVYLLKGHLHCDGITMNENTFHTLTDIDDEYGGTIAMCHNTSKVDFNNSVAHNNVSTGKGGVFHIRGGRLFASNIQADNNSAYTRGGFIFQTAYTDSEGFVLIQKSSFVGNYLRHSSDTWGNFSHANTNNNGMHAIMIARSTIDDGNTSRNGAVINGAPNLLLYGSTVYANSTSAAIRLEGNQMALLLNNVILNRQTDKPSLLQNNSFSFSSKSGYNVMGTVSAASGVSLSYGSYTGDQKSKTAADLGSWAWNGTNRVYTWNGLVVDTPVETPAINYTDKTDNISKAFDEGFMFDYSQNDNNKFNVTQNNIGQKLRDNWGSGTYYKDQLNTERNYDGHYPGAYTKK